RARRLRGPVGDAPAGRDAPREPARRRPRLRHRQRPCASRPAAGDGGDVRDARGALPGPADRGLAAQVPHRRGADRRRPRGGDEASSDRHRGELSAVPRHGPRGGGGAQVGRRGGADRGGELARGGSGRAGEEDRMRILIASDMEGVSGIVKWEQVEGGEALYEEGRRLYTEEINAAVRGAKAAGATEIVVMDCHGAGKGWTFNSLVPELLDPDCEWVVQDEWSDYTGALEAGCDAALLVGMHAKAGAARGVMSHTVSGRDYRDLRFNGV